jgi:hypothetical protein
MGRKPEEAALALHVALEEVAVNSHATEGQPLKASLLPPVGPSARS